jgi:hypothetical protein
MHDMTRMDSNETTSDCMGCWNAPAWEINENKTKYQKIRDVLTTVINAATQRNELLAPVARALHKVGIVPQPRSARAKSCTRFSSCFGFRLCVKTTAAWASIVPTTGTTRTAEIEFSARLVRRGR